MSVHRTHFGECTLLPSACLPSETFVVLTESKSNSYETYGARNNTGAFATFCLIAKPAAFVVTVHPETLDCLSNYMASQLIKQQSLNRYAIGHFEAFERSCLQEG